MIIFLQLVVGISLITLACGTIVYIEDPTFGGGVGLAMAWFAMSIITTVTVVQTFDLKEKTDKSALKNNKPEKPSSRRLSELEKRVTDLQDIVIANDERLNRIKQKSVERPEKTSGQPA